MAKLRLDRYLTELFPNLSREKIQALVMSGQVLVADRKIDKPGTMVSDESPIRLLKAFVSRGGEKLAGAAVTFGIDVTGKSCLDVGISTGGFTDCLLQSGATAVVGVDVGYGQLDFRLRQDPRVFLIERTNARYLVPEMLEKSGAKQDVLQTLSIVVMDLSFISVLKVLPAVRACVREETDYMVLIKPQFEAQKDQIGKGGIIRDPDVHEAVLSVLRNGLHDQCFDLLAECDSPILGTKGNKEFFFHLRSQK